MQKENQKICMSFNLMATLYLRSIEEDVRTDAIKKPIFSLIYSELRESAWKIATGKKFTIFLFCDLRLFEKS